MSFFLRASSEQRTMRRVFESVLRHARPCRPLFQKSCASSSNGVRRRLRMRMAIGPSFCQSVMVKVSVPGQNSAVRVSLSSP